MSKLFLGTKTIVPAITSTKTTSLNITPTTSAQVIEPTGDIDGYTPVNVSAVTASIDSNIQAGNIKKDVTILGVTGTLDTGEKEGIQREVNAQGKLQMPTSSFTFSLHSNATDIGSDMMHYAFYGCTGLTSVDLSSLTTISGTYAMQYAFNVCTGLTSVDLSNLTTVSGRDAMDSAFYSCSGLTSVDLSSLTTVSGDSAMHYAFNGCRGLTSVDLSNLTTLSSNRAMNSAFSGCTGLTSVDLSSLTTVSGNYAMISAFRGCTGLTSVSFPSLTSTSFGSYTNQFNGMLSGVTGCAVHFPSNLQSVIGSWSDVTAGFGGTNTTVLFDLPATT